MSGMEKKEDVDDFVGMKDFEEADDSKEVTYPDEFENMNEAEDLHEAEGIDVVGNAERRIVDTILQASHVVRKFPIAGGEFFTAVNDVSISVPKGCLTILKGRSGSGKTTFMNMLGALDLPTEGEIFFDGEDITKWSETKRELFRREKIGFIFQSVSLIPMMTAFENVEFSLRMAGIKENRKERCEECLKMVGLGGRMHHMPQEMSGGEQQRVAIARAVAHSPSIIFADEPTAELDSATAVSVIQLFKEMVEKENVTIIMTTHDPSLMGAGDVLYELEDGKLI